MSKQLLPDFLKSELDPDIVDMLSFDLKQHLYFFGDHFKVPKDKVAQNAPAYFLKRRLVMYVKYLALALRRLLNVPSGAGADTPRILCNAYFGLEEELHKLGFMTDLPPWDRSIQTTQEIGLFRQIFHIASVLEQGPLKKLIAPGSLDQITSLKDALQEHFTKKNYAAAAFAYDLPFFENLSLKIFKELKKPSFIFLHGIPSWISPTDDTRSDHLIVWGEKTKESYVQAGFSKDKVFVAGHPKYQDPAPRALRFSLDNILVLTMPLTIPGCQVPEKGRLPDRGDALLYLYTIQKVLTGLGVHHVRLRPHPSENAAWYAQCLDTEFFELETGPLQKTLQSSSVVIGPSSSVFLEVLYQGVNYVVYVPSFEDPRTGEQSVALTRPFDGSDPLVPVAKNTSELQGILSSKASVDPKVFTDYVKQPFDISFIKKLI